MTNKVKGILEFMCAARFGEMMKDQRVGEYLSIYGDVPMIAPIVFGEQMIGHLNSTSVYLMFY